jgi:hypothetical protein
MKVYVSRTVFVCVSEREHSTIVKPLDGSSAEKQLRRWPTSNLHPDEDDARDNGLWSCLTLMGVAGSVCARTRHANGEGP